MKTSELNQLPVAHAVVSVPGSKPRMIRIPTVEKIHCVDSLKRIWMKSRHRAKPFILTRDEIDRLIKKRRRYLQNMLTPQIESNKELPFAADERLILARVQQTNLKIDHGWTLYDRAKTDRTRLKHLDAIVALNEEILSLENVAGEARSFAKKNLARAKKRREKLAQ